MSTAAPPASLRASGLLLHPTSLPSPYGIGDLGPAAYGWIDALAHARQKWWQILPLGPTGFGDSPYQAYSAFAGNPNLVSPQYLREDGLIDEPDLYGAVTFPHDRVDYPRVSAYKNRLLEKAWQNFRAGRGAGLRSAFESFCRKQADWLDDYALYMATRDSLNGAGLADWPREARLREPAYLEKARRQLADGVGLHQFRQFLFYRQWQGVKDYANHRGIRIIGDIPIFVSADSADVWANPQFFLLDREGRPKVIAGVPPDYFSATGQLWGNPLYDWPALERAKFAWWVARFKATLQMVDLIRLDHFRGFEAYWEVPAGQPNAIKGKWVPAPGKALLETVRKELGGLPLIAEDLGLITEEVDELRRAFALPGMSVLHFAFGDDPHNRYLPHNYTDHNTVVYTGTHDNDTTWGWYHAAPENVKDHVRRYLGRDASDVAWDLIRVAWGSVGDLAVAPLQDVLNLGSEARMNTPGKAVGNWGWRFPAAQLTPWVLDRLADLTTMYGRAPLG